MSPSIVLSRPSPYSVPQGTLRSPDSLRPCWDASLSILHSDGARWTRTIKGTCINSAGIEVEEEERPPTKAAFLFS